MNRFEQLIQFGTADSGLLFRKCIYGADEDAGAIADSLALANSDVSSSRRFIFFGVDDRSSSNNRLIGVDKTALTDFKRRFLALMARTVEPELNATVRSVEVGGYLIGYIRIKNCTSRPYLTRKSVGRKLAAGVGFIRRGETQKPLSREDLQRLFAEPKPVQPLPAVVAVDFAGEKPSRRAVIPVMDLQKLPSQLAAERLRALMDARGQSRHILGRTQTRISRLMHARHYGMETPFEEHSEDSLLSALDSVEDDYSAADGHYSYEIRAHKLNLRVRNNGDRALHNAELKVKFSRLPGFGIADRIFPESEDCEEHGGYPQLHSHKHTVSASAFLGTLLAGKDCKAFREPLRLWAREEASGKSVVVEYQLTADELEESVKGKLIIFIDKAH